MVKNKKMQTNGFTLVEVIIAMMVVMILSGISLASYGKFNQRKKLDNEVEQFKQVFEVIKKKTVATDKSGITVGATDYSSCDLSSYKLSILTSSSYSMIANICDNTGSCPLSAGCLDITLATYSVSNPVGIGSTGTILFNPTTKTVSGLSSLTFSHSNLNQSRTLTIDPSGLIY